MSVLSSFIKNAMSTPKPEGYEFTSDWFSGREGVWLSIVEAVRPARILEIGSYEGRSTCFLIEECGRRFPTEIVCVDTWEGGVEHDPAAMQSIEKRFDSNVAWAQSLITEKVTVRKVKSDSKNALLTLAAKGERFDLIYVDGSHQAPDVLFDAVLSFELLRVHGVIIFDDYLWSMEAPGQQDLLNMPKPAIDAFTSMYQRKLNIMKGVPLYQMIVEKLAD
jgi:predicted O-methyltransferase YrrM